MKFWTDELLPNYEFAPVGDCSIAAAGIIGAGSLLGAGISAYGASNAADKQTQAQEAAIQAQLGMFGVTQGNLAPFLTAGSNAGNKLTDFLSGGAVPGSAGGTAATTLAGITGQNGTSTGGVKVPTSAGGTGTAGNPVANLNSLVDTSNPNSALSTLLGLTTPGASQTSLLSQTPGFQFASQYGTMAAENSLAARGLAGPGGPLATAVSNYNNGLASTQWSNIVSALTGAIGTGVSGLSTAANTTINPLLQMFGIGANAAGGLANNATAVGQGIGSSLTGIGNAQAGASTSIGNSIGGAVNNTATGLNNQNILSVLAGQGGLTGSVYTPQQLAAFGQMPATSLTDAQANAYGAAYGLTP